jgi:hypothetical protein
MPSMRSSSTAPRPSAMQSPANGGSRDARRSAAASQGDASAGQRAL